MNKIVNLALQILPMGTEKPEAYALVDKAIAIIEKSGLKYQVCPFETVLEGSYDEVMAVAKACQAAVLAAGAEHMMVYMKVQHSRDVDVAIADKMEKYS